MLLSIKNSYLSYRLSLSKNWAVWMASMMAAFCIVLSVIYINRPLLEAHSFRQTQTALTTFWMIAEGWRLDYQTPVVGYPWSVPFEFPVYQSIVALISWVFHLHIEPVGRIVSLFFLLAIAFPARQIVKQLGLKDETTWVFCALLWSSPLYIFWGRSFMIETAGLFFTISTIPFLLRLQTPQPNYKHALMACLLGSLAMLQKFTTALPVLMVFGSATLYYYLFKTSFRLLFKNQILCLLIAYLIPLLIMQSWTLFTDSIKIKNEFGKTLISQELIEWHFGTLQQRFSLINNYLIFWHRMISNNISGFLGILLLLGALVFGKKSTKKTILVCLVLWVVPVFIFFNLHRVHDYYQTSCLIYLIAALTIAVTVWLPGFARKPFVAPLCITILLGINIFLFFNKGFFNSISQQHTPETESSLGLSKIINESTPENSAIIVFGYDWSSEIAFYSKRKSFTVPDSWCNKTSYWTKTGFTMGDKKVSAVLCFPSDCVKLEQLLQKPEVRSQPQIFSIYNCFLWLPGVSSIIDPATNQKVFPLPADSLMKLAYVPAE